MKGGQSRTARELERPLFRARIDGAGMVTPLGATAQATWASLLAGRFITEHAKVPVAGPQRGSRVGQLACLAAREAIAEAGWDHDQVRSQRTALILATSKGPVERWLATQPPSTMVASAWGVGSASAEVASELGLSQGPRLTVAGACASGLQGLVRGVVAIAAGEADRVLVVAAESSLHELFVGSFRRLGVLAKPGQPCRPFDRSRTGFLMSEAAAAVCLSGSPSAVPFSHGAQPALCIDRVAMGSDPTHLVAGDAEARPLRGLLAQVLDGSGVDLVHAHGTGTPANDLAELGAIEACLSPHAGPPPVLWSHKGALGHSLGASGLVSVVLNALVHRHGVVPGMATLADPLPTQRLRLSRQPLARPVHRSIALASGFGGVLGAVSMAIVGVE